MNDELIHGSYDENGGQVFCANCGGELKWDPHKKHWYCEDCGIIFERGDYFDYIGAEEFTERCLTKCCENYPFCRQFCTYI